MVVLAVRTMLGGEQCRKHEPGPMPHAIKPPISSSRPRPLMTLIAYREKERESKNVCNVALVGSRASLLARVSGLEEGSQTRSAS